MVFVAASRAFSALSQIPLNRLAHLDDILASVRAIFERATAGIAGGSA